MSFFNWEFYVNKYDDLKNIKNKEDALQHWINWGIKEERIYRDIPIYFNWKFYISTNVDLIVNEINTEDKAWKHYLYHGQYENRYLFLQDKNLKLYIDPKKNNA